MSYFKRFSNPTLLRLFLINSSVTAFFLILQLPVYLEKSANEAVVEILRFIISFQLIASAASLTGYQVFRIHRGRRFLIFFLIALPFSIAASLIALLLWIGIETLLFFPGQSLDRMFGNFIASAPMTSLMTLVLTLVFSRLGFLEYSNSLLLKNKGGTGTSAMIGSGARDNTDKNQTGIEALSIKEKENYFLIPYDEIIYISAHGKSTVIHTKSRDYRSTRLLKDLSVSLPEKSFMRIHKSFMVHLPMISHIQYYLGGSYLAFLRDEDETNLPVGKSYASDLKRRMNL